MNTTVRMEKELVVKTPDGIGVLARVTSIISEARISIKAICAYEVDGDAHLRIVTSDNDTAEEILKKHNYEITKHDVLRCEVSPHFIHPDIKNLVGSFDVESNYWCAAAHSGEHAVLYFTLKDNVHPVQARAM